MKAISDIIVTGIYVVMFGLNLVLFAMWQKRGAGEGRDPRRAAEDLALRPAAAAQGTRAGDGGRDGQRW